jgi:hypothetical protein
MSSQRKVDIQRVKEHLQKHADKTHRIEERLFTSTATVEDLRVAIQLLKNDYTLITTIFKRLEIV